MALSKEKKAEVVTEVSRLLSDSKLTVMAKYSGTPVKAMQQLRRDARQNGTTVTVVKNRLFTRAMAEVEHLKSIDAALMRGQLMYAFNPDDEVAPAQALANFAKTNPQIEFIGAINAEGVILSADDVKALADLPSKEQLRGMLAGTIGAPLSGFVNVMAGNVRGVMNVLSARASQLES